MVTRTFTRRAVLAAVVLATLIHPPTARAADPSSPAGGKILIFAAASLKNALDAIAKDWSAKSGTEVVISYAASPALAKQIEAGAPADIFAAADSDWMDYVEQKGLMQPTSRASIISNTLVLIAASGTATDLTIAPGFPLAEAIGDSRLAMGEPMSVPAGKYAKAALTSLGVWDKVASKIAATGDVRSALEFVARGEAKFGIVYQSDARAEPKVKVVATFPPGSHPPIVYPFALTASTRSEAAAFLGYLKSPAALAVFEAEGFRRLP